MTRTYCPAISVFEFIQESSWQIHRRPGALQCFHLEIFIFFNHLQNFACPDSIIPQLLAIPRNIADFLSMIIPLITAGLTCYFQ